MPTDERLRSGFTMVELLVVIAIVSIMSGVTYSVLNINKQRDNASDGVARSNMQKLIQAVESYYAAEGRYPSSSADPVLSTYISHWPDDVPQGYTYTYYTDATRSAVGLAVETSEADGIKYRSEWGELRDCADFDPSSTTCLAPTYD